MCSQRACTGFLCIKSSSPRARGVSRQHSAGRECSRQEDGRVRLPVASAPPFCGSVASQLSSSWLHLCYSFSLETPSLILMAAEHVQHMQKALDHMNLHIHRVLNNISGMSSLRILDAILAGERDPYQLFLVCCELVSAERSPELVPRMCRVALMINQNHNVQTRSSTRFNRCLLSNPPSQGAFGGL
jgi:hypothetical protein